MELFDEIPNPESLLDVRPGEHKQVKVPVALRASGEPLSLTFHVAQGGHPGPRLGLLAMMTGDSIWGGWVIRETLERTDLDRMRGSVVALPVANPIAFESFTRTTGQGMNTDYTSLGRTFPGDPGGWLTQRMSAVITKYFLSNVDVVVSYASGADTSIHYTLVNGEETDVDKRSFALSRLLGTELMFVHKVNPHGGGITDLAKSQGKLTVIPEMGGTGRLPANYLDTSVTSTLNLMKGLGMLGGEPELPDRQLVMRPPRVLPRIAHGGLFEPLMGVEGLGQIVKGGQALGRVIDPHTFREIQTFTAPYAHSAMLMLRTNLSRVNPGDYGYIIADADTGEYLDRPADWRVPV